MSFSFLTNIFLKKPWATNKDDEAWVNALADRHVGSVSLPVREAWQILFNDIYVQVPKTAGILPTYRPKMGENSGRTKRTTLTSNFCWYGRICWMPRICVVML